MARQKNKLETTQITISTTPQVERMLEDLVQTGLFGKNPAEAADRVLSDALRVLLSDPALKDLRTARRRG